MGRANIRHCGPLVWNISAKRVLPRSGRPIKHRGLVGPPSIFCERYSPFVFGAITLKQDVMPERAVPSMLTTRACQKLKANIVRHFHWRSYKSYSFPPCILPCRPSHRTSPKEDLHSLFKMTEPTNNITNPSPPLELSPFHSFTPMVTFLHEGALGCVDLGKTLWSPPQLPPCAGHTLLELLSFPLLILILLWSALTTFYHPTEPFNGEETLILLAVSAATKVALAVHTCLITYNLSRRGVKDQGHPFLQIFFVLEVYSTGFFTSSKGDRAVAFFIFSTRFDALFAILSLVFWYQAFYTKNRPSTLPPPTPTQKSTSSLPLAAQRTAHLVALKRLHAAHAADLRAERERTKSLLRAERLRFATALSTASKQHGDWYTQHFTLAQGEWKLWVRSIVDRAEEKVLTAQREMERAVNAAEYSRTEVEKARTEVKEAKEAEMRARRELGELKGSVEALLKEVKEGQELAFMNIRKLEDQVEYWEDRCERLEVEAEGFGFVGREEGLETG